MKWKNQVQEANPRPKAKRLPLQKKTMPSKRKKSSHATILAAPAVIAARVRAAGAVETCVVAEAVGIAVHV
jgi:hypothetical protein